MDVPGFGKAAHPNFSKRKKTTFHQRPAYPLPTLTFPATSPTNLPLPPPRLRRASHRRPLGPGALPAITYTDRTHLHRGPSLPGRAFAASHPGPDAPPAPPVPTRLPPPATHRRRRRLWIQRRASWSREQNLARTPAFGPPSEGRALTPSCLAQDDRTASHGGVDPLAWLASIHRRRGFYLAAWHVSQHSLPLRTVVQLHPSELPPGSTHLHRASHTIVHQQGGKLHSIQRWKCAEMHRPSPNCTDSDPTPSQSSPVASGRSRPSRTEVHNRRI
ncbi:uncharacterized protein LOC119309146 [Triticum dicoccoides]|uniref:uncharacterized protein LOC119309146 n=1 Tax=Triticum dicoccoides TaxID=85692 RepID=UPI001891B706|nr:uncharacterized protein LOC119309146 [Triticum dicoccoides]